jgi:two-component system, OmpR family, sensor kinase
MKIRHRITLWITFAGLLSSLALGLTVFFLMLEEPFELLDQELAANARTLETALRVLPDGTVTFGNGDDQFRSPYWIRIVDERQRTVFTSDLVKVADLPLRQSEQGYTVNTDIPMQQLLPEQAEDELTSFRVRIFPLSLAGRTYHLQIARPVENLRGELTELALIIGSGLIASALVLILAGHFAAGRILRPIQDINATAREINAKTLDKRIPVGSSHDELHALSSALNSMFDRLQFSFLRQKEFIANASHELKTPITLLRLSFEETLQDEHLPEPLKLRLDAQNKTLLRMSRLVKDLLDLSALELTETCEAKDFDFNELASSVMEDFQPLAQEQGIHCLTLLSTTLPIRADREKIKRMLINLVDNAIKYNRPGGEIRLQAKTQGKNGVITLFNTGSGIPTNEQERVFEQFYRVEKSRATSLGGSGLGLTIVRRIVELHGGTITLQSKPGEWTQFQVILPLGSEVHGDGTVPGTPRRRYDPGGDVDGGNFTDSAGRGTSAKVPREASTLM